MEYSKKVLDDLASLANLKKLKDQQELLKPEDLLSMLKRNRDEEENMFAKEDEKIAEEIFSKKRKEVHRISDEEFENSHKKKMENMHLGVKEPKCNQNNVQIKVIKKQNNALTNLHETYKEEE